MVKIKNEPTERRKYVRLHTPLNISYTAPASGRIHTTTTKNVSADGLRLETNDKALRPNEVVELKLIIAGASNPVHAKGRVVWKKPVSLEDGAPFDVGFEFVEIEEDNKNTFLKFLCDLIYEKGS